MIRKLNHRIKETAADMLRIQLLAYEVEADLMDFKGIPQLHESASDIQASEEQFLGYCRPMLQGFISYKLTEEVVDIHRLVVDPAHFRKGIARALLLELLTQYEECAFIVSTGTANEPAKNLYQSFGFSEEGTFFIVPGISCAKLRKEKQTNFHNDKIF